MSKKIVNVLKVMLAVMMIASCSAADEELKSAALQNAQEQTVEVSNDWQKKLALFVAENKIEQCLEENDTLWTKDSKVTDLYPIYIAGTDEIVYYECKIKTNEKNSGYIIVCVTEHDILIPEISEEGCTLTEKYREALNTNNFKILRYDWFTSAAESENRNLEKSQLLASVGIFGNGLTVNKLSRNTNNAASLYSEFKSIYADKVISNGAVPPYMSEDLEEFYSNEKQSRGNPDYKKTRTAALKNSTIKWKQSKNSNGYPSGCGNTAWAIVYAYWHQFKGKDQLFVDVSGDSLDLENYNNHSSCNYNSKIKAEENYIYNAQWEIFTYTNSINLSTWGFNGFWGFNPPVEIKNGLTWPSDMNKGIKYGKKRGYSMSFGWRNYGSDGWRKTTNFIYDSISTNNPAILLIATSGLVANHYVVIEKITETYWARTGEPIEVELRANFGWGNGCKRIFSLTNKWRGSDFKVSYDVFVPIINN